MSPQTRKLYNELEAIMESESTREKNLTYRITGIGLLWAILLSLISATDPTKTGILGAMPFIFFWILWAAGHWYEKHYIRPIRAAEALMYTLEDFENIAQDTQYVILSQFLNKRAEQLYSILDEKLVSNAAIETLEETLERSSITREGDKVTAKTENGNIIEFIGATIHTHDKNQIIINVNNNGMEITLPKEYSEVEYAEEIRS